MAKGFFDVVDQYNKAGYGAFRNQGYTPEELAEMYRGAGANRMGGGLTLHERLGANAAGFLGSLGNLVYQNVSPKAKAARAEQARATRVADTNLEYIKQTAAEAMAADPTLDYGKAMEMAARQVYADTASAKSTSGLDAPIARDVAHKVMADARGWNGEVEQKQYARVMKEMVGPNGEVSVVDVKNTPLPEIQGMINSGWRFRDESKQVQWQGDPADPERMLGFWRNEATDQWEPLINDQGQQMWKMAYKPSVTINTDLEGIAAGIKESDMSKDFMTLRTKVDNTRNVINLTDRITTLIDSNPNSLGTIADIVKTANNAWQLTQNLYALYNRNKPLSERDDRSLLENWMQQAGENYDQIKSTGFFKRLADTGVAPAAIQSLYVALAYIYAKANNPDGRIATSDYDYAWKQIGGNLAEPKAAQAVLREAAAQTVRQALTYAETSPLYFEDTWRPRIDSYVRNTLGPYLEKYNIATYMPGDEDDPLKDLSPEERALVERNR